MLTWRDFLAQEERCRALLRERERNRLVRQALASRERRKPFYCRVLIWLGERLLAWGQNLQKRYEAGSTAAVLPGSNRVR